MRFATKARLLAESTGQAQAPLVLWLWSIYVALRDRRNSGSADTLDEAKAVWL